MAHPESPKDITEREQLSTFITLATTALNHRRPEEPVESKTHADDLLLTLQHLTTLLTTGTPPGTKGPSRDPAGNRVFAVTATTSAQHISTLILVTQNTREKLSPSTYHMQSLKDDIDGGDVLLRWIERDRDMYFKNVFAILNRFRQTEEDPRLGDDAVRKLKKQFHLFVINHTFPKIVARILKGNQSWKKHPIDVLAAARPQDLHVQLSFPKTIEVRHDYLVGWLSMKGIVPHVPHTPGARAASFQVTPDTLDQWVHAITDTFAGLKKALIDDDNKCKPDPELEDVIEALNHLLAFRALLKCGIIEYLLSSKELAAAMKEPSGDVDTNHVELNNSSGAGDESNEEVALDVEGVKAITEEEDDVIAEDLQTNKPRDSIIRYLKTIVAWTEAVESLTARHFSSPITAHIFAAPHPYIDSIDKHLATFKTNILTNPAFSETERIRARDCLGPPFWFSVASVKGATVHAEALMMALSRSFYMTDVAKKSQSALSLDDKSRTALQNVFQTARSPIAVSKKCCWCCWRLYLHLHPAESSPRPSPPRASPSINPPNIVLLGSHSTIYPWSPPPIGVPIEFLRDLKVELEAVLIHTLKQGSKSVEGRSRQSSARSSGEHDRLELVEPVNRDAERAELVKLGILTLSKRSAMSGLAQNLGQAAGG